MIERFTAAVVGTAPTAPVSDHALLRRIAYGDKAALRLLYLRHRTRVYRFVLRLTGSDATADEVVNEVFLQAWRHAAGFEGKSQVATWLLSIARFKALSAARRCAEASLDERVAALIEDPVDSPVTSIEKRQRSDILQKCLATLSPDHRDVINLIYYQEKNVQEVALRVGVPAATIKTRLHYARVRMAQRLAEVGVDRGWVSMSSITD